MEGHGGHLVAVGQDADLARQAQGGERLRIQFAVVEQAGGGVAVGGAEVEAVRFGLKPDDLASRQRRAAEQGERHLPILGPKQENRAALQGHAGGAGAVVDIDPPVALLVENGVLGRGGSLPGRENRAEGKNGG